MLDLAVIPAASGSFSLPVELITEHSPNLIFVKDEQFRVIYGNKAFFALFPEDQRQAVLGSTMVESFSPEETEIFLREDKRAFDEGYAELIEEIVDYQGITHTFLTRKRRFVGAHGETLLLGISTDISVQAERERQLLETNHMLKHFAAVAGHDLRSPLASFVTTLEFTMTDKATKLSDNSREFLEMMQGSARNLISHVNRMLERYQRSEIAKCKNVDTDMNQLFAEVRFNLSRTIADKRAKVLSNDLPRLKIDPELFHQLLHNLIENSLKYGRPDLTPIIILRHMACPGIHRFVLEDNGQGIAPEAMERLFRPRHQGGGDSQDSQSSGLGLSFARTIVEQHRGRIWVDPKFKRGCRIILDLPADGMILPEPSPARCRS